MNVIDKDITTIYPYERNPRDNKDAVRYVKRSIQNFGFQQPIVIDTWGIIIAGHTRYMAALELGMATVPVVVADNLTDEQVKAYRLADNKVAEIATWDEELLKQEIAELQAHIDMSVFAFDVDAIIKDAEAIANRLDNSSKIKSVYEVIVVCKDERELERTYNKLASEGYQCRISTL